MRVAGDAHARLARNLEPGRSGSLEDSLPADGNRADADECFQEACLAALEVSRRKVVHNWRGLLQRLAAARAVGRLQAPQRARSRMSLFPCDRLRDDSPSPPRNAEEAELAGELRAALAQIPPSQAAATCMPRTCLSTSCRRTENRDRNQSRELWGSSMNSKFRQRPGPWLNCAATTKLPRGRVGMMVNPGRVREAREKSMATAR